MSRPKNIKIQLHKKINSLLRIGESKHEAKKEYRKECERKGIRWNPSKSPYIHSINTVEHYRDTVNHFSEWLKEEKPEIWQTKDLNSITKDVCYEYLKEIDSELSAWTTSRHMAGLNKVLDLGLNKKEGGLKKRRNKDITRSRTVKENDFKYNPENYREQIDLAKAFGLRRESILGGDYEVKESSLFIDDDRIYCGVIEKGGKYREALCLKEYEDTIKSRYNISERVFNDEDSFKAHYKNSEDSRLFDRYTKKIDNHSFRREYAQNLYQEIKEEREAQGINIENDYRGYNKDIVINVSNNLGHNRPDVVIDHYLE